VSIESHRAANARYLANPENRERKRVRDSTPEAAAARARYAKTPEGIAARKRARAKWKAKPGNAEKERAAIARWLATPEGAAVQRAAEARVQATAKGKADRRAARLRYQGSHKDRVRMARYRAAKRAAPINDLSGEDWAAILEEFQHCCAYCGSRGALEQDHVWPLSRRGSHTKSNVVPACRSCNSSKGPRTLAEWLGFAASASSV
jgi:5-methylcytosine-specific restriction endonuclease McrA